MWLTYRTFALKKPVMLRWCDLYRQFGAHPSQEPDRPPEGALMVFLPSLTEGL